MQHVFHSHGPRRALPPPQRSSIARVIEEPGEILQPIGGGVQMLRQGVSSPPKIAAGCRVRLGEMTGSIEREVDDDTYLVRLDPQHGSDHRRAMRPLLQIIEPTGS